MKCDDCMHATADCCEYYGGYKEWFVDGCELQAPRSEENEKGEVIACEDYEDTDRGWPD